jgi:hypothetical protein
MTQPIGYGGDVANTASDESGSATDRPRDQSDELKEPAPLADRRREGDAAPVTVTFTLPSEIDATSVSVVGDFNDWEPDRGVMARNDSGAFSCTLKIAPGRTYQYRYLLDGDRWTNDWSAHAYAPNIYGGEDSVLDLTTLDRAIKGPRRDPDEPDASLDDEELRSWIDAHDPPTLTSRATELDAQRKKRLTVDQPGATERPDDALAPLINNTGDDGGAATG